MNFRGCNAEPECVVYVPILTYLGWPCDQFHSSLVPRLRSILIENTVPLYIPLSDFSIFLEWKD